MNAPGWESLEEEKEEDEEEEDELVFILMG